MKDKIKLVLSIALIIASLFKSFLGGVFILLAGLVIYPKISEKLLEIIPIWKNRAVRIITPLILYVIGASTDAIQNKDEIALDRKEDVVIEYIKQNADTDRSLSNLKLLAEIGTLFNNGNYFLEHPHDGYLKANNDTINGITKFIANPRLNFSKIIELGYLVPKEDNINDYSIVYEVNQDNKIISNKTIITYDKAGKKEFDSKSVPDLSNYINREIVNIQKEKLAIEEQNRKDKEAYNQRVEKFENDCLSSLDGSHRKFKQLIKNSLNDPSSFDHVITTYRLFKGYAVVNMTFRGKNAFNATVTNKMSAKVSLEDCSVIEIFE